MTISYDLLIAFTLACVPSLCQWQCLHPLYVHRQRWRHQLRVSAAPSSLSLSLLTLHRQRVRCQRCCGVQKLMVFNHPSWVDSVLLLALFAPSGVSRQANTRIPVIGTIIRSFQNIYTHSRPPAPADSAAAPLAPPSTTEQIATRCSPAPATRMRCGLLVLQG